MSEKPKRNGILRSATIVGAMTAISRVLGLVREIAMGYLFGTSPLKSAFDMAFVIPNLFRRLFGEGALSSAFIPVLSETLEHEGKPSAWKLASKVLLGLGLFLSIVTAIGILITFPLSHILPPDSRWLLPLPMLRIMLPYAVLICLAATVSGVLNCFGAFSVSSLTPFLLNVIWLLVLGTFIIFPDLVKTPDNQLIFLCIGILFAGLAQILFQWPTLRKFGFRFSATLKDLRHDPKLKKVLLLTGPAAIGMGLIQINVCIDKVLAYWADSSAPAALEYAERITYLPLGMFATAFMTVLLPTFSRQASAEKWEDMRDSLEQSVRNLSMVMAPCSLALLLLAAPIIQSIYAFKGGHFGQESILLSARALAAYAPGLVVFSLQKVFTPAFYGMQDMKTPVKISLWCLLLNVTLNVTSVILLPHGWKHCGIAGSTVVCSLVNSMILFYLLRKKLPCCPRIKAMLPSLLKSIFAAIVMAWICRMIWNFGCTQAGGTFASKWAEWGVMGITIFGGGIIYLIILLLISRRELLTMIRDIMQRRGKSRRKAAEKKEV